MSDKHKGMVNEHGRSVRREKMVPVAPESQQGKAPGSGPGNRQSDAGSASMGAGDAGTRGGPGTQTGGRSARQQGQRMQAQAEADRLGTPQQSGHGGLKQKQHGGSHASPMAPGSQQSGGADAGGRGDRELPASDYGSGQTGSDHGKQG